MVPSRRLTISLFPRLFSDASVVPKGPDLSAIVIPLIGQSVLANCLDRLPLSALECIVVLREAMGEPGFWRQRYPSVIFLQAFGEPVPLRRQRGVAFAGSDVVAFLEDTSWPDPDWCNAVRSTLADVETGAVGGPVRIAATLPSRCQALGWGEYGAFAPHRRYPQRPGSSKPNAPIIKSRVPGNNMAFRRAELIEALRGETNGLFEGAICAKVLASGRRVVFQPQMLVTYSACDHHNVALSTRLHHGRIYAGGKVKGRNPLSRIGYVAKTALLPFVLSARGIVEMTDSGRLMTRLPVLFWLILMQSAWALGEAIGAVAGPGKSLNEWR
jgi:hypothetical protein